MEKKFRKWIGGGIGFFLVLTFSPALFAEAPANLNPTELAARFENLEAQIHALQNELAEQEKKHKEEIQALRKEIEIKVPEKKPVYLPPAPERGPGWLEGLEMGGDLRLRYEAFEENEATRDRNLFRYRFRWKFVKHLTEDLDLGFRMVSGSSTNPVSQNQTLSGDFTYKNIFLDQAYVKYRPSFLREWIPALEGAEIGAGKFENPFFHASSLLVWDPDVMAEGLYESLELGFLEGRFKPFVHVGQFLLQENATGADAELYGFQTGIRWHPPGFPQDADPQLTHAFAYYDFSDYARDSNFIVDGVSLARGNTRTGDLLAAKDFDILQIYNELRFKIRDFPVKLFGDFALNLADRATDPLDRNVGYEYGVRLGEAKKKGDWEVTYYYALIEPNSVVSAFTDDDFAFGGARRGSAFQFRYRLSDFLGLRLAAFFTNNVTGADDETRRFQTDLEWTF